MWSLGGISASGISFASLAIASISSISSCKCDGSVSRSNAIDFRKPERLVSGGSSDSGFPDSPKQKNVLWLDEDSNSRDKSNSSTSILDSFLAPSPPESDSEGAATSSRDQTTTPETSGRAEETDLQFSTKQHWNVFLKQSKPTDGFVQLQLALRGLSAEDSAAPVLEQFRTSLTTDSGSWLIIHLSKTGRRKTSMKVLEWLSDRKQGIGINAYNSLITAMVRNGEEAEAIAIYERMKADGIAPTLYTYTAILRAISHVQGWESSHRMFSEVVINGPLKPDVVMYNTMLAAYGRGHKLERVLQTWQRMQSEGCQESVGTYCLLISTFVQTNQTDLALEVYARMIKQGLKATDGIYRGLVCVCATQGRWLLALSFFKEMLEAGGKPTIVTYNVLMRALGKAGKWEIVLELLPRMKASGIVPDFYTVNAVLNGLIAAKQFERAMEFFNGMKKTGTKLDREVYNVVLVVCQRTNNWEEAILLIKEMQAQGITPNEVTFGPLLIACEKTKQVELALKIYEHMKQRRCIPNTHVVSSLIRICGREMMWEEAREIYQDFRKAGQKPNVYVYNALIDAYCRSKKYYLAKLVDMTMAEEGCAMNSVTQLLQDKYFYRKLGGGGGSNGPPPSCK